MIVVRQFYVADLDSSVNMDVRADGDILGAAWAFWGDMDAEGDNVAWELSFASSPAFTSHDAAGVIIGGRAQLQLLTSGGANIVDSGAYTFPMPLPVAGGERLFLHVTGTGLTTAFGRLWLYIDERAAAGRPAARRGR